MNFDKKYNMIGTICKSPNLDFIKNLKENMKDKCKVYVEIGVLYGGSKVVIAFSATGADSNDGYALRM